MNYPTATTNVNVSGMGCAGSLQKALTWVTPCESLRVTPICDGVTPFFESLTTCSSICVHFGQPPSPLGQESCTPDLSIWPRFVPPVL